MTDGTPIERQLKPGEVRLIRRIIQDSQLQVNGAVAMICAQEELPGQWAISPDMTKLIRVDAPQPATAQE